MHERWKETKVTIHKTISEDNNVVILWSFTGTWSINDTTIMNSFEFGKEYTWGGITIVSINESGKIYREVGEESAPGPFIRLNRNYW